MADEPQSPAPAPAEAIDNKTKGSESQFMSVSIRGWIVLIVVLTACAMSICRIKIDEPLYTMVTVVVGFYFGQKTASQPPSA